MRDYLEPEPWVQSFLQFLRERARDPGNPEIATVRDTDAADFCTEPNDWLILTNRVAAAHQVHVVAQDAVIHFHRHRTIRNAVDAHPRKEPLSINDLAALTKTTAAEVRAVVQNMIEGPTAQMRDAEWLTDDRLLIRRMSFNASGMPGDVERYPRTPLEGLYERVGTSTATGASGSVAAHRLVRQCTFGGLGKRVAVKIIPEPRLVTLNRDVDRGRARLLREFRTGRAHDSPRLVRSLDVFPTRLDDPAFGVDTRAYALVMEHVEGTPLSRFPAGTSPAERQRCAIELALAVADLHELGFTHRDVKPDNAISTPDGRVVLLDFGIAKASDATTFTEAAAHLFTWRYASPEQMDDAAAEDPSMDIYALGVSVYEILTGSVAWHWEPEWKHGVLKREGPMRAPDLHGWLGADQLILRMTSPDPRERPRASEAAELLRGLGS